MSKIANLRKNKVLFLIGATPILYGVFRGQLILMGVSMVLWAILFAGIFGVFFIWIALAGAAVALVPIGNPVPSLLAALVMFVVLVFDNISFVLYFVRNPEERQLLFKADEDSKRQLLSRLKDHELFYILGRRMRKVDA